MNSIGPECYDLKQNYDHCFNKWFGDTFLKGPTKETPCPELFAQYQACIKKSLKEQNINIADVEKYSAFAPPETKTQ